jgi:hypothetical protein
MASDGCGSLTRRGSGTRAGSTAGGEGAPAEGR